MPKTTFRNLSHEKQERIKQAILNEFLKVPLEEASIKNIVDEANIPRGSFYQYFEDKEDAFEYIVKKEMEYTREVINEDSFNNINIFKLLEKVFVRELEHFKNKENTIKSSLFKQISKSTWAMDLFTNILITSISEEDWFYNEFKKIGLEIEYLEPVIEMSISALKEAMISMLNLSKDTTIIHDKLRKKLTIIHRGIKNIY